MDVKHFKREWKKLRRALGLRSNTLRTHYKADGLGVRNKELSFLEEPVFKRAWAKAAEAAREGRGGLVPDIRWRAHIALWAAQRGLQLEGDFVECGVYTGLLSLTICDALEFAKLDRRFFLFDTFEGIPLEDLVGQELETAARLNKDVYEDSKDVFETATRAFSRFPNAELVRGVLPESLKRVSDRLSRIAYLSVDLNNAKAEKSCIEELWPRMSPGAMVVIDDYAFKGHRAQFDMWNEFSAQAGAPIVTLPTGQGLMIKP